METASLLSGVAEGEKVCDNPFVSHEEDPEELENNETDLDDC